MRPEPWYWLNENSRTFLARGYLADGQTAKGRVSEIARAAEAILQKPGFAERLVEYVSKGWFSFASPVWANFGTSRGLPISCFGSYIADDMSSILYTHAEVGMMSKYGGGTSAYFGALRERGAGISDFGSSNGPVTFTQLFETMVNIVSQGKVRRGSFSPYLPIEHPDILEFLEIGTEGNPIQTLTHGVTVSDEWLKAMIDGDEKKRAVWARVIQRRGEMGYPYVIFLDNANRQTVDAYKDKDLKIVASNLCSEIMLPSRPDWSFVCCLSSVNVLWYDDWKDTRFVEDATMFLDAVMSEFCTKLEALRDHKDENKRRAFLFMERAYNFARDNRALGLGVLGYHSLLQSKQLPFASSEATKLNVAVFRHLQEQSYVASALMAKDYGEPPVLTGYGRRNTTTMAIAPTTSSAFILGQVSQGIEPVWSNCYVKDLAKHKVTIKNPFLKIVLEAKGCDNRETWNSIRDNDGSVQHLKVLDEDEKAVFRTFAELDQNAVIDQAAARQPFIDQGQSLNVMVPPHVTPKDINALYIRAWKSGVKALYYQHSMNAAQELTRQKLSKKDKT